MNLDLTELFLFIFERGYPPWLSCPRASQPAWLPGFVQKRSLKTFSSAWFWFTNLPFLTKFGSSQNFISQNIILIYLDYFIFYNKHLFYLTLKKKIVN